MCLCVCVSMLYVCVMYAHMHMGMLILVATKKPGDSVACFTTLYTIPVRLTEPAAKLEVTKLQESIVSVPVLVRASMAAMKHHDHKQVWRKRFIWLTLTQCSLITEGSQNQNSNRAGTWRQERKQRLWMGTGLFPMAYSAGVLFCL